MSPQDRYPAVGHPTRRTFGGIKKKKGWKRKKNGRIDYTKGKKKKSGEIYETN